MRSFLLTFTSQEWCKQHNWEDGDLIREIKLVAFLKEVVKPRKTGGRRAILTATERDAARRKKNKITKRRTRQRLKEGQGNAQEQVDEGSGSTHGGAEVRYDQCSPLFNP